MKYGNIDFRIKKKTGIDKTQENNNLIFTPNLISERAKI